VLRRLELAWGSSFAVEWASLLALSVWAYGNGGAEAVGLVGLLRMLPAAIALPFGAAVADRFPRHRVLVSVYLGQALLIGGVAAVIQAGGPDALTYLLIALVGIVAAPCRPAQLALAPLLARSPEELVAANVTQMTFEGLATLVGPALAGVILALSGPPAALVVAAAFALASALLLTGVRGQADPTAAVRRAGGSVLDSLGGGVRELARLPDLAVIVGGFWVQTFVRGMLNVLVVSLTLTTLNLGEGAVGFISGTFGAGVLLGALGATSLVGVKRLGPPIALALAVWGLPLVAIAVHPGVVIAVAALVVSGIGNAPARRRRVHAHAARRRRPGARPGLRRDVRRRPRLDGGRVDRRPYADRPDRDQGGPRARRGAPSGRRLAHVPAPTTRRRLRLGARGGPYRRRCRAALRTAAPDLTREARSRRRRRDRSGGRGGDRGGRPRRPVLRDRGRGVRGQLGRAVPCGRSGPASSLARSRSCATSPARRQ